jgi:probable HAF family extracellular repeat protein
MKKRVFTTILLILLLMGLTVSPASAQSSDYTITDLNVGNNGGWAADINEHGQIVGRGFLSGFLWDDGVLTDLGHLGGYYSTPYDINEHGQVVGTSNIGSGDESHAFLWEDGVMTDLGALGTG